MWEAERYDWPSLRAMGSAAGVPEAIERLRGATSSAQCEAAYWKLENVVVVQGRLFEAALPATICLVSALATTTSVSRPYVLELLVQLGSGTPDPSELALGNAELGVQCRRELAYAFGTYVSLFEQGVTSGAEDDIQHCIDLLLLSALSDESLQARASWLYQHALGTGKLSESLADLIRSSRAEFGAK